MGDLNPAQIGTLLLGVAVLGLVAAQWWFLFHLLGQIGRLLVRMEELEAELASGSAAPPSHNGGQGPHPQPGLPVGAEAPQFALNGLHGERLTLESLRTHAKKPVMLIFTDPNCGPCTTLLPEIARWQQEHSEKLTIALISRGEPAENRAKASEHALTSVLLQEDWEVSEAYQVRGTPSALLVSADGKVGSSVASGPDAIRSILTHVVSPQAPIPVSKKVGEVAPEVKLPGLQGNPVELEDFRGEKTLVLFWNPGCGFCQQMLSDLKQWEANSAEDAPKLLVVSTGTEEANKEMDLASPVVLDQQFAVGRAFGASGTPSAVLVDPQGRVASEVAVGGPAVLELAKASRTGP
jgi:peroxiredoxin